MRQRYIYISIMKIFLNKIKAITAVAALVFSIAYTPNTFAATLPTGGTITTFVGNGTNGTLGVTYRVHSFTTSGALDTQGNVLTLDYLVVAGGGAGTQGVYGQYYGNGGGGGQVVLGTKTVTAGSKTVTVGAGGVGVASQVAGNNGANSVFDGEIASGGQGGRHNASGASTGGDSGKTINGTFTARTGGLSSFALVNGASGGGGAGADGNGVAGTGTNRPDGGVGYLTQFTGTATYYGGGGGAARTTGNGVGGLGGGANGSTVSAFSGQVNTGGGGGSNGVGAIAPGSGGSGVVMVRYATLTLTYNGNGSTGGTAPTTVTNLLTGEVTVAASVGTLTKTGAVFAGWNTAADGSGTSYTAGSNITVGSANITLYAQWSSYTITPTTKTVAENGGTGTFTVVLDRQPSSNVVFSNTSSNTAEATVSPSTLTFTSANWNTPQTVTVTGVNDSIDTVSNDTATITVSVVDASTDDSFDPLADQTVVVTATDDDVAGFTIVTTDNLTGEDGATGSFTIVMTSQPTANVSVALSSSNTAEGTVQSSVVFTTTNWNTPQTVTVTGVDDVVPLSDGTVSYSIVTGAVTSTDPIYGAMNGSTIADVSMQNTNNDPAGTVVTVVDGTTDEGGGTAKVRFSLLAQPAGGASVTIPLSISNTAEGTLSGVTSITISNANWNNPAANEVTITGVDDIVADGIVAYTLVTGDPTSADPSYDALTASDPADPVLNNYDNDIAGVTISESGSTTNVTEGGATDTYTVVLNTQPTANVTINVNGGAQTSVSPNSLTFTNSNWNTPQTVTVTAINDSVVEGSHTQNITQTATSVDTSYNALIIPSVTASITDNDSAGFTLSTSTLSFVENAGTGTFIVVLGTQPTSNVTFNLTSASTTNATVAPSILTFTNVNWNTPQTVTVTGVHNTLSIINNTTTVTVAVNVAGSDPSFASIPSQTVSVITTDVDDTDQDGNSNAVEDAGFNGGDGNGDGILDSAQASVAGAPNSSAGGAYTTLQATGGCNIVSAFNVFTEASRSTQDSTADYPLGLNNFRLNCASAGQSGTITIFYDRIYDTSQWVWKKFNSLTNAYTDVTSLVSTAISSQTIGGAPVTKVTFTVTDGGAGDEDGISNSTIVDPIGPAVPTTVVTPPAVTHRGGGVIRLNGCSDIKALNYSNFVWHVQSTCVYPKIDLPAENKVLACKSLENVDKIISLNRKNNKDKVKALETFLNTVQKEKIKIDGVYDKSDAAAVNRFQAKWKKEILTVQGIKNPTGIWGIFTNKKAKELSGCK